MTGTQMRYVLITPARNEAAFIELTIKSMIRQSVRPLKWIVVDDGSTDSTGVIAQSHARQHEWMEVIQRPNRSERDFAGKVASFNVGFERIRDLQYDIIGNVDGDLSFEEDLFEMLIQQFKSNPRLGVAGAPFNEGEGTYDFRFSSIEHVSGACQLFRRKCFEDVGGYQPLKGGGIDVLAVLTARMKGWQTRTFPERTCFHHRSMGSATDNPLKASFNLGKKDFALGRHPLWQLFRSIYQMRRKPLLFGGIMLYAGYVFSALRGARRAVPGEIVEFQRREQMGRLKAFCWRLVASKPDV
jgi:GT2 family glycosyltransferase